MWQAIQYVTGGLTLIAFLAGVAAWTYLAKVRSRERIIATITDPKSPSAAAQEALEFFKIDTTYLADEYKYDLAKAGVICLLSLIFAGLCVYAISKSGGEPQSREVQMKIDHVYLADVQLGFRRPTGSWGCYAARLSRSEPPRLGCQR
jgi:hypothetical protein